LGNEEGCVGRVLGEGGGGSAVGWGKEGWVEGGGGWVGEVGGTNEGVGGGRWSRVGRGW